MNSNQSQHDVWRKVAPRLVSHFASDYRNNRMACDPWARAAQSMVQGWRNIISQGRLGYVPQERRRISTWCEAATNMKASLYGRMKSRLIDTTTWRFWANHLPRVELRYIRKSKQKRHALAAQ